MAYYTARGARAPAPKERGSLMTPQGSPPRARTYGSPDRSKAQPHSVPHARVPHERPTSPYAERGLVPALGGYGKVSGGHPVQQTSSPRKGRYKVVPTAAKSTKRPLVIASGVCSQQGKRPTMEDVHSVHLSIPWFSSPGPYASLAVSYAAVYDGHCGRHVAELASQLLPSCILSQKCFPHDPAEAMVQAFTQTDRSIYKKTRGRDGGSTCSAALIVGNELYVANLGDARAVLVESGGKGQALSTDHKPTMPSERARVEAAGGRVALGRVGGCLAVSRAFGDYEFKGGNKVLSERYEPAVSNVPEVTKLVLTDSCEAVILACDGVWDVVSSEEAAECVYRIISMEGPDKVRAATKAAEGLVHLSMVNNTTDNVSVVVLITHTTLS